VGTETIFLLRVGECPRALTGLLSAPARTIDLAAPYAALEPLPPGTLGEDVIGIAYLDPAMEPQRVVVACSQESSRARPGGGQAEVRDYLTQISHLRVARSTDGVHFVVDPLPAVLPVDTFEEYGYEDPRATLIDGVSHITYV
jgi:predicted GH43/DUF377 family glycosyl hydrolase